MKKIIIILLICLFSLSCETHKEREARKTKHYNKKIEKWFFGEKNLRTIRLITSNTPASGDFFICFGTYEGEKQTVKIRFSWKTYNGDYIISSFPIEKFRVRLDNEIESPHIKFVTYPYSSWKFIYVDDELFITQKIIDKLVRHVVVVCHPKHWKLNMGDLNKI